MRGVLNSRVAAVRAVVLAFVASMVIIVGVAGTKPAEAASAGKNGTSWLSPLVTQSRVAPAASAVG